MEKIKTIKKVVKASRGFRCPIPKDFLLALDINPIKDKVFVTFDGDKIVITKCDEKDVTTNVESDK